MTGRLRRRRAATGPPAARLAVALEAPAWRREIPAVTALVRRATRATLQAAAPDMRPAEVSIVLADDERVRALNRDWRKQDKPTNVLSFPARDAWPSPAAPVLLGDVVVAFGTAAGEAAAAGKTLADHLAHLVVHGVLHLLGHDHRADADWRRMHALERRILKALGIADPTSRSRAKARGKSGRWAA
ncbi:MAG: rRNA maturation RNase YbeY [Pseudomonadota bacterium]